MIFKLKKQVWRGLLVGNLSLLACACMADDSFLKRHIQEIKTIKSRVPSYSPWSNFVFLDNANGRDPFMPAKQTQKDRSFELGLHRRKQVLEYFSLERLKFVGFLQEGEAIKALIKQPNGIISVVIVGDFMGKNNGRVLAIANNSIRLEETIKKSGGWKKHTTTISLYEGE